MPAVRQRRSRRAWLRNAASRACARGAFSGGADCAHRSRQHRTPRRLCAKSAIEWMRAPSTSSSARRCSPRVTISPASRWSACLAPTMRFTAPIFAPPSASQRCCFRSPAGRGARHCAGEVIVQTDFPEHPLYQALAMNRYGEFAASLMAERRAAGLPPFAHLALVTAEALGTRSRRRVSPGGVQRG